MFEEVTFKVLPFIGLLVGAVLSWLVPYLRTGFEAIEETDDWKSWPKFKLGYLSMTLYPLISIGVSILTEAGALATILQLDFISAVLITFAGSRLGHEGIKIIHVGIKALRRRF